MTQADKKLTKWRYNKRGEGTKEEVEAILKRYFPGQYCYKGSHIVVTDERLKSCPGYGPEGDFTIVIKSGQKVEGRYLNRLAKTVYLLNEDL